MSSNEQPMLKKIYNFHISMLENFKTNSNMYFLSTLVQAKKFFKASLNIYQ